jgi:hypothetical protein
MEALGEERRAWPPPCMEGSWRLRAQLILWRGSCLEEGALGEEGASLVGRTFRAQIAVRSVSEGGYSSVSECCGGVS